MPPHVKISPTAWRFKERDASSAKDVLEELQTSSWMKCSQFPTEIHLELLKAGKIPHPYKGRNEHEVQWVGEREWLFTSKLHVDVAQHTGAGVAELEFESLDTFATVYLNGKKILKANNHFVPWKVSVPTEDLVEVNELLLHFLPAGPIAKALEAEKGQVRAGSCNLGDPSRVYVRKMQACWRWDWGPEIMTIGPDRPITLHIAQVKFDEVFTRALVDDNLTPTFEVGCALQGDHHAAAKARFEIRNSAENVVWEKEVECGTHVFHAKSSSLAGKVDLWWPNRQGAQTRYSFTATLFDKDGHVLDIEDRKIGFRRIRLLQEPLKGQPGTTFLFEVNNRRIFIGGSNWIPTDQILPMVEPERYRTLLTLARDGNQNMIRCWGGGVYEPDAFYDLCDELGLLVWQDFQFACGIYPGDADFVKALENEATSNVKRLRHHPSMALFCGGNENYQQIRQWDIDESLAQPLPALDIHQKVFAEVVANHTRSDIPYLEDSPMKAPDSWRTDDPTRGDLHQWQVWARSVPWQDYDLLGGRFVSEFGMPSLPCMDTIDWWMDGNEKEKYIDSKMMTQHNKAGSHVTRFAVYMNEMFRTTSDLETYAYRTQVLQSEALTHAYSSWRRGFQGPGKEYSSGAIVWQLNDSWPVSSWAIVDYFCRPKPAYYAIKRHIADFSVGIMRTVKKNRQCDRPRQFYEFGAFQTRGAELDVWACNGTTSPVDVTVELNAFDIATGWTHTSVIKKVQLRANASVDLATELTLPEPPREQASDKTAPSSTVVVQVRIFGSDGSSLAEQSDWPQPYRFLDFPDPSLKASKKGDEVTIAASKPVKCLWLEVEGDPGAHFSDNGFDLMPGHPKVVVIQKLAGRKVKVSYMGSENARRLKL